MINITVKQSVKFYMDYHKNNSRPNTIRSFKFTLNKFEEEFSERTLSSISDLEILLFLDTLTDGLLQATKNNRASHLSALFNFISESFDLLLPNPCRKSIIKKLYKNPRKTSPKLIDKELIDEIIYRADGKERLILELMGRTAMRINEVLNIKPKNLNQDINAITIDQPKSGRLDELVFLPKKLMKKLDAFATEQHVMASNKIFNLSYSSAFRMVRRLGNNVGVCLRPHDLRRHAATQASRAGVPLEVVSKVILRHADLATTQRYLGKIDANEASRVIETLLG